MKIINSFMHCDTVFPQITRVGEQFRIVENCTKTQDARNMEVS